MFRKGTVLQVKGSANIEFVDGEIDVIGHRIKNRQKFKIPEGKSIPVEMVTDSTISIDGEYEELSERTIPEQWDSLLERINKDNLKRILILGEVDTGKSFFTTYIANKLGFATLGFATLSDSKKKVAILDCDIGQSDIGPPGTLGLSILDKPILFLHNAEVSFLYFIGGHSPSLHFLPMACGIVHLKEKADKLADILIVDTTGWVQGDGGRNIKLAKMELLKPDLVVLLQKNDELEHLVKNLPEKSIARIEVSRKVTPTSKKEREKLRIDMSIRYFKNSQPVELSFSKISTERCYFRTGKEIEKLPVKFVYAEKLPGFEGIEIWTDTPLSFEAAKKIQKSGFSSIKNIITGDEKGLLVGLLDYKRNCPGLGIIKKIDFKNRKIIIVTPVKENDDISIIQFGSLRYTLDGVEDGFFEPGYF